MMIDSDTKPPKLTAKKVSRRKACNERLSFFTKAACRNKLYGTTVVPNKPTIVKVSLELNEGINMPRRTSITLGWVRTAVNTKEILINKTIPMRMFFKSLWDPKTIKTATKLPTRSGKK